MLATTALAITLMTSASMPSARADEHRGGDAALGALSGAVVFGPVGAVAGAVVGYTAGPSIARSWGFRRSRAARSQQVRRPVRDSQAAMVDSAQPQATPRSAPSQPRTAAAAPPAPRGPVAPPVQTLE
jgi:predicted lipid-binding transport protein (Tim44 family)